MKLPSLRQFMFIFIASILLGHFFISLGRTDTIIDLVSQSWYYIDLFFVTIIVFVLISFVATVHYTLDQKLPISTNIVRRFIYQGSIGIVAPIFLCFVLTFAYMTFILDQDIFETSFLLYEFPIAGVVIMTINLVFVVISLMPGKGTNAEKAEKEIPSVIIVNQGTNKVPIQLTNVAGISKEGDYTVITTFDQQQYVSSETLEDIMTTLPPPTFYRANRQWIIHRSVCGAFTTERSGKVELTLKAPFDRTISISQNKGREFKGWLAPN